MNVKNRISRLEAQKGTKKKTAMIYLPRDMKDEDDVREWVERLTSQITEPFGELVINELNTTEPRLAWFGNLDELLAKIAAEGRKLTDGRE